MVSSSRRRYLRSCAVVLGLTTAGCIGSDQFSQTDPAKTKTTTAVIIQNNLVSTSVEASDFCHDQQELIPLHLSSLTKHGSTHAPNILLNSL